MGWLTATLVATSGLPAQAQAPAQSTLSDNLFQDAKALMEQDRIPEACQKFAESLALARRGGTLLNLAICRAKEGKNATAVRLLVEARDVATRDGRADRVALAAEHLETVRSRLSWLTLRPAVGDETPGLTVLCDGERVPRETWGTLQAIDPGKHLIVASAPGRARFEATVSIGDRSEEQLVEIPWLAAELPATAPTVVASKPDIATSVPTPPVARSAWRVPLGWATLGFGVGAITAGSVLGVLAINNSQESKKQCALNACPLDPYTKNAHARTEAVLSDITIPVGVVSAGVGLYLLLRPSPRAPSARPRLVPTVGPGAAGLALQGVW